MLPEMGKQARKTRYHRMKSIINPVTVYGGCDADPLWLEKTRTVEIQVNDNRFQMIGMIPLGSF